MSVFLQDDCFTAMKAIPDNSIGMVFLDLPYGRFSKLGWDNKIDLDKLWPELERVIMPGRAIVATATGQFTIDMLIAWREHVKYRMVWDKGRGFSFQIAKIKPLSRFEDVIILLGKKNGNSVKVLYNPQLIEKEQPRTMKNIGSTKQMDVTAYSAKVASTHSYPTDVLLFPNNNQKAKINSTQKPVDLLTWLILTYSNEGDVILDPTAGSGTTGIACANTNRQFILIEKDKEQYAKTVLRLKQHAKTLQKNYENLTGLVPNMV